MKLPNISKLSYLELDKLIKTAQELQSQQQNKAKAALIDSFKTQALEKGLTLDEVMGIKGKRSKVAPKYRNPNNANETWAGRGRQPRWVVEALAKGASIESLKI